MVCPEHAGQLHSQLPLGLLQGFSYDVEESEVIDIGLVVTLGVIWHREPVGNLVLGAEFGYLHADKLWSVVG